MGQPVDYCAKALEYARAVVNGEIDACKWVKLACRRHLDDLDRAESDPGFSYIFDEAKANRPCYFLEGLPHVRGTRWVGTNLSLEPWQCWIVNCLFGWVDRETGLRRFQVAYIELPRKNGKSLLAAGIGLYMLTADGEAGAEVYSGATTEKQAWEVFRPARLIALQTPKLCKRFGIEVNAKTLAVLETGSRFEPVIGKPGDGASPSCAIVDEYHEHDTDEQYDTMKTGMGAREQPIMLVITTAGVNTAGPCYAMHLDVENILTCTVHDDSIFGVIYTLDPDDDWTTEEALKKANPNWGVSIIPNIILAAMQVAIRTSRKQNAFKTKHANIWCGARDPFFNMVEWQKAVDTSLTLDQFKGENCWIGMDLANKEDITAVVTIFKREIGGEVHYYPFAANYLPEDAAADPAKEHYLGWVTDGWLQTTSGCIIDYDTIKDDLLANLSAFNIRALAYDPWGATQLATQLMEQGMPVVEIRQTTQNFSEPMKWLNALILAGRVHHNGDPALAWMLTNVTSKTGKNDTEFPNKERLENKIDAAVALIMALGRAMDDEDSSSVYETRGLMVL